MPRGEVGKPKKQRKGKVREAKAVPKKALGFTPQEIVVIGDSYRKDIYPSNTLGCKTVWLKNICWEEEPVVEGYEATYTTDTLENVPQIIEQL